MEIVLFWAGFSVVVAVAANARGRSAILWFLLTFVISPLLALLFVLVLERKNAPRAAATTSAPFEPESVNAGIPCRSMPDGSIEAIMQGVAVWFASYLKFSAAVGAPTPPAISSPNGQA